MSKNIIPANIGSFQVRHYPADGEMEFITKPISIRLNTEMFFQRPTTQQIDFMIEEFSEEFTKQMLEFSKIFEREKDSEEESN